MCSHIESCTRTQSYLSPVLTSKTKQTGALTQVKKYELFSLQALKLSIELFKNGKNRREKVELGEIAIQSLRTCADTSGKASPLMFEKLLVHFINNSLSIASASEPESHQASLNAYKLLAERLAQPVPSGVQRSEVESLRHMSFNILWKSGSRVKQEGLESPQSSNNASLLCLRLRKAALQPLVSLNTGASVSEGVDIVLLATCRMACLLRSCLAPSNCRLSTEVC